MYYILRKQILHSSKLITKVFVLQIAISSAVKHARCINPKVQHTLPRWQPHHKWKW